MFIAVLLTQARLLTGCTGDTFFYIDSKESVFYISLVDI